MLEFKEYIEGNHFLIQIMYKDNQIGAIQQNNKDEFYATFRKSDFYWLDAIIKEEGIATGFDLEYCKDQITEIFEEIKKCFQTN